MEKFRSFLFYLCHRLTQSCDPPIRLRLGMILRSDMHRSNSDTTQNEERLNIHVKRWIDITGSSTQTIGGLTDFFEGIVCPRILFSHCFIRLGRECVPFLFDISLDCWNDRVLFLFRVSFEICQAVSIRGPGI